MISTGRSERRRGSRKDEHRAKGLGFWAFRVWGLGQEELNEEHNFDVIRILGGLGMRTVLNHIVVDLAVPSWWPYGYTNLSAPPPQYPMVARC